MHRPTALLLLAIAATPLRAEDLLQVWDLAQAQDPQFRSTEANLRAVQELRPQAKAQLMLPELSANAGVAWNDQDIESSSNFGAFGGGGSTAFDTRNWSVNLRQPVYHYDRIIALRQADKRIGIAELGVASARQELMLRTSTRYFGLLAARDTLEFATAEKAALARQLEQARQRFEVGLIAITDVQEAQAAYDLAVAEEILAQNAVDNAVELLRELTGGGGLTLTTLGESMPLASPEPADIEQWTATALQQNLDLQQALATADVAQQEIAREAAGHHPTLDIVGSTGYQLQGGRFGTTDIDASAIGVELNVPLYAGGQVVSRTRAAGARHEEALERLEQQRRATERETRNAYLGVMSGISRVKALKQAVVSTETALAATRAGFEVGTRTTVDVVASERELYRAKRDYARARYDYILDALRLKRAAGTLNPEDLTEVNSWLATR